MAKNVVKLLLQAAFACCLALGFSTAQAGFKSGFESTFLGELAFPAPEELDTDSSDVWLPLAPTITPFNLWVSFKDATQLNVASNNLFNLKPIRAPPATR